MSKKIAIATLVIVSMFVLPIFAQEKHPIDKFEEKCISKNPTTAGMANCTYEAKKKWDEELNENYKLLMVVLDKDDKEKLRESQRAWIKFRDAEFEVINRLYPKEYTLYINIRAADKMAIVKERALQLRHYAEVQEDEVKTNK